MALQTISAFLFIAERSLRREGRGWTTQPVAPADWRKNPRQPLSFSLDAE
jgi:hypothetical protein